MSKKALIEHDGGVVIEKDQISGVVIMDNGANSNV